MNCHSSGPLEPATSWIQCDGCGLVYLELTTLVWHRLNGTIREILCIECDPLAGDEACLQRPKSDAESQ